MRKARVWAVAIVATSSLVSLAIAPANAKPIGGCPDSYTQAFSLREMVKVQKDLGNKGATTDALVPIDKNADGSLCWKTLPQGANDQYTPVNVIDNTSN
jgi:hypothetical protein